MRQALLTFLLVHILAASATAGLNEWTSAQPTGEANAVGGHVIDLRYGEAGEAYILSTLGNLHMRASIGQPWTQLDVTLNGDTVRLEDLAVGPGTPAVLLGKVGLARMIRSTDGGLNWVELNLPSQGGGFNDWFYGMVMAPSDANTFYYTGRFGTVRSIDGGQSFEARSLTDPEFAFETAVHPLSAATIVALASGSFLKSTDAGLTWQAFGSGIVSNDYLSGFGLDPTDLQTYYAGSNSRRIYKTIDGGLNWSELVQLPGTGGTGVEQLVISPVDPDIVFAVTAYGSEQGSVHRSTDRGTSWTRVAGPAGLGGIYHADLTGASELSVGSTAGVFSAADGITFAESDSAFNDFSFSSFTIAPTNEQVHYGTGDFGGVIVSTDGGQNWERRTDPFGPMQTQALAVDLADASHAYVATVVGLYETVDTGANWQQLPLSFLNDIVIAPSDSNRLYARQFSSRLLTSADGGQTWDTVLDDIDVFPVSGSVNYPIVIAADDPLTVYLGTYDLGLYKSTDGGASWTAITDGLPNLRVNAMAIDPDDPQRLLLGLDDNVIVLSEDGGTTWMVVTYNLLTTLVATQDVAFDPFTAEPVVLLRAGRVYLLREGATSWTQLGSRFYQDANGRFQLIPSRTTRGRWYAQYNELFVFDLDSDNDGVADAADNCLYAANADQRDTDADDIGNICDPDVAIANDCFVNFHDLNVYRANFLQAGDLDTDNNGDGITNFLDLDIVRGLFFRPPGPSVSGCN